MEIKIEKQELQRQLQLVQGIAERKTTMPILSNVLITAKDKKISLTGTDLEVAVICECKADVLEEGNVTVQAKGLFDIVKELSEDVVHIKTNEKHWLEISCGKSEFKLVGLSGDEYPALPTKGEGVSFSLPSSVITEMFSKTSFSMSNDEARYNLNGVLLETEEENGKNILRMVSTDGHRLSIVDRDLEGVKLKRPVILPRKGVSELKRLLETQHETFSFWIDPKYAIAHCGDVTLIIRLIDGQFPPYRQVLPKKAGKILNVDRKEIYHALKRVSAMSSDRSKGVKFHIAPKVTELSTSNPDFGQAKEDVEVEYHGQSFDIGFNGRYFLDALSSLKDETCSLEFGDDTSPCVFRSEFDTGYVHVIMPMRL
ncbi:MAG: DNA polymerase III subunit beta [Deltaproteobacteria bacterium CG11_big_fil_rev_8_21_14_0_20_42_23]|nr:MAG: DNA polymerase III subunit beta [Deltaproteobacteria bacterium CG11_big_fil_rev_8_21_14_0_20_42_23]PJC64118.1 MAG: DNA polymerase III subunit beta [Deltaproteobacteria bacterium CG_4_9_14_0_2_um_filter_42_21]